MDATGGSSSPIEGERLRAWSVLPGGTRIGMDFTVAVGQVHRIVLPFEALPGLLMTLPRMLQSALDTRFADRSLRFVQQLGRWQIEQAEADAGLILKLGTRDGFEVSFVLRGHAADSLGAALLAAPDAVQTTDNRKPH